MPVLMRTAKHMREERAMKSRFSPTWTVAEFRCPLDTPSAVRAAKKFIRAFRSCGGEVVSRGCGCGLLLGSPQKIESALLPLLPPDASMRLVGVTDAQFGQSETHWGKLRNALAVVAD